MVTDYELVMDGVGGLASTTIALHVDKTVGPDPVPAQLTFTHADNFAVQAFLG